MSAKKYIGYTTYQDLAKDDIIRRSRGLIDKGYQIHNTFICNCRKCRRRRKFKK